MRHAVALALAWGCLAFATFARPLGWVPREVSP